MNWIRKTTVLCAALTLAVAMVVGSAGPAAARKVYKIGALFATSGPASMLGLPEKNTASMLEESINSQGGINGTPIKLIIYDTQADPTKTVTAAKKLIKKDKVDVIIGPTTSGATLAIIDVIQKAEIPLISCAASVRIVQPVKKWVFKTPQTDVMAVEKIYAKLQKEGKKKIAIITVSNGFGDSGRVQLKKFANKYGITVVADERYGSKDTDMTVQMTKIKGTDAEAIICWGTNPGPAVIAKNRKQLGITIPLYNSHGVASKKFIELSGGAAEGTFLPAGRLLVADQLPDSDPQKAVLVGYRDNYEKRFGGSVSTFGGHAYDAFNIAVQALRNLSDKKMDPTRGAIRSAIEKIHGFVGTGGVFNFSPEDHNGLTQDDFVMIKIENGSWKLAE
ncbi:MAG TPA: ABC transporter substrate-binding protein [Proteobacteria bacterium]|nr:leucine-, isoleucine-, valine-, threonine-, and alanine-binding protein precursor [bacterium BMS3Abin14]HDL52912.1 ABC transporter substrate-binding protein [Pseudomonadota bacterium]